ncbi:hypothetical protein WS68_16255 [Burkholderia sp. TSV86]|nr:hypothetical protein WS68_16255 [Burkholderia sp. TSV86]
MNVRRQPIGLIERANANERHQLAAARIMPPPPRDMAGNARSFASCQSANACARSISPCNNNSLADSINARSANDAPVCRWRQQQWQQCTMSSAPVIRQRTARQVQPPS